MFMWENISVNDISFTQFSFSDCGVILTVTTVEQQTRNKIFMANCIAGSGACWDPSNSPHSAHLHLPGATQEVLWHSHHLLNALLGPLHSLHDVIAL